MSTGFRKLSIQEAAIHVGMPPSEIEAIAAHLKMGDRFNEGEVGKLSEFKTWMNQNNFKTASRAIAHLGSPAEREGDRQSVHQGATAATPQDAMSTIQKGMAPAMQATVDIHQQIVAGKQRFVSDLVQMTIAEVKTTPAEYLQSLQKALQGNDLGVSQVKHTFDLAPAFDQLFALPQATSANREARQLLPGA